ncbi:hypothetical protein CCR75_008191 [Bremia lactucae]|uniref:HIT domain-containing protein n=1 Tax=Bremia lactucae TaxID=4779 RepID=A0A976FJC5_BRELC|nr:hypothetical protein CCR75_008191 [Bremia lactucae]
MKNIRSCTFCCKKLRALNDIIYEDAKVMAMMDRNPRAKKHVLVIPLEHIPFVDDLLPMHFSLLKHMLMIGKHILITDGFVDKESCRFGFHRSPFASVSHLHLHCLGLPFRPWWNQLRFIESVLPSYVNAESVVATLRNKQDPLNNS